MSKRSVCILPQARPGVYRGSVKFVYGLSGLSAAGAARSKSGGFPERVTVRGGRKLGGFAVLFGIPALFCRRLLQYGAESV